jgi:glycosyltransferase involved in cell wall biosynthesis
MPALSVLIPVYNNIPFLELVLAGYEVQSFPDFEIVIGDDGSREEMRNFVATYRAPFPIRYCWQEDKGFRKTRILNESIRRSSGGYLVFADADCIPHRHFVYDHWKHRQPETVLCGRRVDMGEKTSASLTPGDVRRLRHQKLRRETLSDIFHAKTLHWEESFRIPFLGIIHWKGPSILGSNFSLTRELIERVNGFNEEYEGYGYEDPDIDQRLRFAGARMKALRHCGIQYHLYHGPGKSSDKNRAIYEAALASRNPVCTNGLKKL